MPDESIMPSRLANTAPPNITGTTRNGDHVETVKIISPDGMSASILTLGARLIDLRLSDNRPLTLSFEDLKQIEADDAKVGVFIGRTSNRIRAARLSRYEHIDRRASLEKNDVHKQNHIHGGITAWDKRLFAANRLSDNVVELNMFSPHGDQGYPSSVNVVVRYELRNAGQFRVIMTATNVGAEPTVTNMTLHPYFDLKGQNGTAENSVLDYSVHAPTASHFLTLDSHNVPTGEIASVTGTSMDFRKPRLLHEASDEFQGYDHYFVTSNDSSLDGPLNPLLTVTAPPGDHGPAIEMEVSSNQPGFQMYTANGFSGDGPPLFAKFGSLAIEPSGFIDATNNASFPTVELCPGETRRQWPKSYPDGPEGSGYAARIHVALNSYAARAQD